MSVGQSIAVGLGVLALAIAVGNHAHADPQPALDRQLVERMTRALEANASATRDLVHAVERCNK